MTFQAAESGARTLYSSCLDRWRALFSLSAALSFRNIIDPYRKALSEAIVAARQAFPFKELQLATAYDALCSHFLGLRRKEPVCEMLPGGPCPLESKGYGLTSEASPPLLHAELGIVWCLYGNVTGVKHFLDSASKLARWQLNTLDHRSVPFAGLFGPEGEGSIPELAMHNALLFGAVAQFAGENCWTPIIERQWEVVRQFSEDEEVALQPHLLAMSLYIDEPDSGGGLIELPNTILDNALAMAGIRGDAGSGAVTLFGSRSGMGCFHGDSVRLLSYGPQRLPLGDCLGYGVEGGMRILCTEMKNVEAIDGKGQVSGVARMASRTTQEKTLSPPGPSGIWIDLNQTVNCDGIIVEAAFQQVYDEVPLAFSFFVQCDACSVGHDKVIRRRSFDKYQGKFEPIRFGGGEEEFELTMEGKCREMHVVPLGGGENFWGADYLIAFLPESAGGQATYRFARQRA